MNRPNMEQIKEDMRIFERPTCADSKVMFKYILELEAKIDQLQNTSSNNKYTAPQATPKSCTNRI